MTTEKVYIGRDNLIDLQLQDDSSGALANTDLSNATKVAVVLDATTSYDSTSNPDEVSFTEAGVVSLKLGGVLSVAAKYTAEIVVYDVNNQEGIAWQPRFVIDAVV